MAGTGLTAPSGRGYRGARVMRMRVGRLTAAAAAPFPVCGAGCPSDGSICAPIDSQVGAFFFYVGCACGDPAACSSGGVGCPPGSTCTVRVVPGISLRYCASPAGAFLDD